MKFLVLLLLIFGTSVSQASYRTLGSGSATCPASGTIFKDHFCWTGTLANRTPSCVACLENHSEFDTSRIIRGGQPNQEAVRSFKKIGVRLIINLRSQGEIKNIPEEQWARESGIAYINLPMQATVEGAQPNNEKMMFRALGIIRYFLQNNRSGAVYIHCQRGEDRTGLVIAGYQYLLERFTNQDVRSEMRKHYFKTNYPELYNIWKTLLPSDVARIIEPTTEEKLKLR